MQQVLAQYVDEKGRPFELVGDVVKFREWADELLNTQDEDTDDEYFIGACQVVDAHDTPPTLAERTSDKERLKTIIDIDDSNFWMEHLQNTVRKKNGTLAKNRIQILYTANTFAHYWEDSYGWNTPMIRIQNMSDDTAVLQFGDYLHKY